MAVAHAEALSAARAETETLATALGGAEALRWRRSVAAEVRQK